MDLSAAAGVVVGGTDATSLTVDGVEVWAPGGPADPTTTFWYNFNGGVAGNDVTTSDTGSGTAFDNVSFPYLDYASTGKDGTGLCGQIPTGAAITSYVQWDGTTDPDLALGMWVKIAAAPTGDTRLMDIRNTSSSGTVGGVLLRSDLTLRLMVGASGQAAYTSSALSTGSWYWVTLGAGLGAGTARLRVYTSAGASFYDSGALSSASWPYSTATTARFGRVTTAGDIGACQFDDIQFNMGDAAELAPWGV